jgi:isopentenyl diphosphate isomerase/L-lactate dehydrogenase-like FMN-dependent dehydrogenase
MLLARLAGAEEAHELITAADRAIDVFDFEAAARAKLSPPHWTFLSMGVQHEVTLRRNRSAFDEVALRPRRLVDTRELDTSLELFGQKLSSPILLAPCGSQRAFHPEGELAVARAARKRACVQILSTGSSTPLGEVVEARGGAVWFQLYTPRLMPFTRLMLKRAEEAGCPVVVLTVDQIGMGQNRDRLRRYRRRENPECQACHDSLAEDVFFGVRSALDAVGVDPVDALSDLMTLDWGFVDRIRDSTDMKLVVKGILTAEDAALCVEHGVDGIVVSNHGGRAEDSGLASIEALPEVVRAVAGRIPILIDSGFRRGSDCFKALALGARAVCIGRPYLWGLASFGQQGVEAVLDLLDRELHELMVEMGTPSLSAITRDRVRLRGDGTA